MKKFWLRSSFLAGIGLLGLCLLGSFTSLEQNPAPVSLCGTASPAPHRSPLLVTHTAAGSRASPQLPAQKAKTLIFVGDVMLSRGVGGKMRSGGDWTYPFRQIAETLRAADLIYGNLECPVSDQGRDLHHLYSFRADPRILEGLKYAGFVVLSQANNHAYDWGPKALLDSLRRLRAEGIRPVGAGQSDLEAHYPVLVNLDGVKIGFLAYVNIHPKEAMAGVDKPGVAWLDPERVLADIRFARSLVDILVVCPHWGVEYATQPTREQVDLGQKMIDAGADLIVGSHPHVVQPLDQYRGRWIAYSLGNFVFDQKNPSTHRGLMLKVTLRGKQVKDLTLIPITIANCQAMITPPREATPPLRLASRTPAAPTVQ
jgi:poly-gamma-glutamate synthesis protein (capsule biosynthesis protein)